MAYMKVRKSNDEWFTITDLTLDKLTLTSSLSTESLSLTDNKIILNNNSDSLNIFTDNKNTKKLKLNNSIIALEQDLTDLEKSINNMIEITTNATEIKSENAYSNYEISVGKELDIHIYSEKNKKIHAFITFEKKPIVHYYNGNTTTEIDVSVSGDDITSEGAIGTIWEFNAYIYKGKPYIIWKKW